MKERVRIQIGRTVGPDRHWVIPQVLLLCGIVVAIPLTARRTPRHAGRVRLLAIPVLLTSVYVIGKAKADLSQSFTMSPTPVDDGQLIEHGIYATIRHPMYLSVVLFVAGYAIAWMSPLGALFTAATFVFVALKARHEDLLLRARYRSCEAYQKRVRSSFVPGIF